MGPVEPHRGVELNTSHPVCRELLGFWVFNEGTGSTVRDLSGNNYDGTITHLTWASGKFGFALENDGVLAGEVEIPSESTWDFDGAGEDFTVEGWVYIDSDLTAYSGLIAEKSNGLGYQYGWSLDTDHTDRIRFLYRASSWHEVKSDTTYPISQWTHVVGVCDADTLYLYVNGIQQAGSATMTGARTSNSSSLKLVICCPDEADYLDGKVELVRIWGRALRASDIRLLYSDPFCMVGQGVGFINGPTAVGLQTRSQGVIIASLDRMLWFMLIAAIMWTICARASRKYLMCLVLVVCLSVTSQAAITTVEQGGTGKSSWTAKCIPFMYLSDNFGEIPIGDPGQYLQVIPDWGNRGYQWVYLSTDDVSEGANLYCTLQNIKDLLHDDFHNIGGNDNDVPDGHEWTEAQLEFSLSDVENVHTDEDSSVLIGSLSGVELSASGSTLTIADVNGIKGHVKITGTITGLAANVVFGDNLVPLTTGTYNLGAVDHEWQDMWVNGIGHIDEISTNAIDIIDNTVETSSGDLNIKADGGDIDFDDENLATTGHADISSVEITEASQDYKFHMSGSAYLACEMQGDTTTLVDVCYSTGDEDKNVIFRILGLGTADSQTNTEQLRFQYAGEDTLGAGNAEFRLWTHATGSGDIQDLEIYTSGNSDQLLLQANNDIVMANMGSDSGTDLIINASNVIQKKSSSERFKDNIRPIEDANKIYQLQPRLYDSATDPNKKDLAGLIAEEVVSVIPEMVTYESEPYYRTWETVDPNTGKTIQHKDIAGYRESNRPLGLQYDQLTALLLHEVQRMRAEMDQLKARLAELEKSEPIVQFMIGSEPVEMTSYDISRIPGYEEIVAALLKR
jgi:hypothetical protein